MKIFFAFLLVFNIFCFFNGVNSITAEVCASLGHKQFCCNGILGCIVQALGSNCGNEAYCCDTGKSGVQININLLNCIKLL